MPTIIPTQSALERNRELLRECILSGAEAAHHTAVIIQNANERIWTLPTAELLDLLNDDVPRTLQIFKENTAISKAVNARLDGLNLPQFPARAPTSMGRSDIELDTQTGKFVHVPPVVEEEPSEQPGE